MVPLIINPIYTLYSGYLLGFIGYIPFQAPKSCLKFLRVLKFYEKPFAQMAPHLDTGLGGAKSSSETQRLVAKLIRNCRKTGDSGSSCCCCCLKKRGGGCFSGFLIEKCVKN